MAEDVRATFAAGLHTYGLHSASDFTVNPRHRPIGRPRANEDFTSVGLRTPIAQIGHQRLSHWLHQWQERVRARLGMADAQGLRAPVDIVQPQMRYLSGP